MGDEAHTSSETPADLLVHSIAVDRSEVKAGVLPCGLQRTRGLLVTGNPDEMTCQKCHTASK